MKPRHIRRLKPGQVIFDEHSRPCEVWIVGRGPVSNPLAILKPFHWLPKGWNVNSSNEYTMNEMTAKNFHERPPITHVDQEPE